MSTLISRFSHLLKSANISCDEEKELIRIARIGIWAEEMAEPTLKAAQIQIEGTAEPLHVTATSIVIRQVLANHPDEVLKRQNHFERGFAGPFLDPLIEQYYEKIIEMNKK